jgi:hypothetical protein
MWLRHFFHMTTIRPTAALTVIDVSIPGTAVDVSPPRNIYWNVPRAPSSMFTGRQALLERMKNHLITECGKKDHSVFVLQGYGGAGKSEVAIKFATDNQDKFVVSSHSR